MSNTLNQQEMHELARLGKNIITSLSCHANATDVPCRACRFAAVEDMKRYLKIHDYKVSS